MGATYFKVSSITYAAKGRDLLRKYGYSAYMERDASPSAGEGCGYVIMVSGNGKGAEELLLSNNIRIYGITAGGLG